MELVGNLKSAAARHLAGGNGKVGMTCLASLSDIANGGNEAAVWNIGDAFDVPNAENLADQLFINSLDAGDRTIETPGLIVLTTKEGAPAKDFYFSTPRKRVVEYKKVGTEYIAGDSISALDAINKAREQNVITEEEAESARKLYNDHTNAATAEEVYNLYANNYQGKRFTCKYVLQRETARRVNGVVAGIRRTNIPVFVVTDAD